MSLRLQVLYCNPRAHVEMTLKPQCSEVEDTSIGILETMVSGIPFVLGRATKLYLQDLGAK